MRFQTGMEPSLTSGITPPTVNIPNMASIPIPPPAQTQVQPQSANNQPVLARNPNLFFPNSGPRFFEIDSESCTFGWCGNECCPKMTTIEASPIPGSYSPSHPIVLVLHPSNAQRCSPMCQPQCSPQCLARLQYSAMPITTPPHNIRPPVRFPSQQQLQCRSDCMPSCHVDCLILPPTILECPKWQCFCPSGYIRCSMFTCCSQYQEAPSKKVEIRKETKNCGKIKKNSQSESNEDRSTVKPEETTRKEEFSEEVDEFGKEIDKPDKNDKEQFEIESERRKIVEGEIMIPTTDLPRQITIPMSAPIALRLPPRTTPVPTLMPIYPEPSGNSLGERSKPSYNLWQYRSSTPAPPTNLKSEPELPLLRAVPNSKPSLRSRPFISVLAELTKLSPKREFFSFKEAKNYLNLLSLQTA
ncbi:hypothetical protein WR25_12534 [Diploscapter pachys]|uniref:Uncharacterized protein n=1 Tax=Diploscapter pachys TaxID=2018661 RepID=A0A2A2JUN6_9BILA|nr:hypothetical protein WR25_12534 [Diploscapter pachys]